MNKLNKRGFTLVELVIVIAVIAILAAVLIPTFSGAIQKANESAVLQAARSAYEEALTMDLTDGTLDDYEGTKPSNFETANLISTKLSKAGAYTVTIQVTDGAADYTSFKYQDLSKGISVEYKAGEWKVLE